MKSYTIEEFSKYVEALQFEELEDIGNFILEYYEYYKQTPDQPREEKDLAYQKYMVLLARYGLMFISFSMSVIDIRKQLDETYGSQEKDKNSESLSAEAD